MTRLLHVTPFFTDHV